ncbi:MAG: hypothetical protein AAF570_13350, partial [Bacteroidota bacterium]
MLALLLLEQVGVVKSQYCATQASPEAISAFRALPHSLSAARGGLEIVPVQFHVMQEASGQLAMDLDTLADLLAVINSYFEDAGILFEECSEARVIRDTTFWRFDASREAELAERYDVPHTVNIYVPQLIFLDNGELVAGYADFPPGASRVFVTGNPPSELIAHELG